MPADRINNITLYLSDDSEYVIPWAAREQIVPVIKTLPAFDATTEKFEAVGTTRPLALDADEERRLVPVLDLLLLSGDASDGIGDLRARLVDLHGM